MHGGAGGTPPPTTQEEKAILDHLTQAWSLFLDLPDQHPDDPAEARTAIHAFQCLIAWRVARRADPETWGVRT